MQNIEKPIVLKEEILNSENVGKNMYDLIKEKFNDVNFNFQDSTNEPDFETIENEIIKEITKDYVNKDSSYEELLKELKIDPLLKKLKIDPKVPKIERKVSYASSDSDEIKEIKEVVLTAIKKPEKKPETNRRRRSNTRSDRTRDSDKLNKKVDEKIVIKENRGIIDLTPELYKSDFPSLQNIPEERVSNMMMWQVKNMFDLNKYKFPISDVEDKSKPKSIEDMTTDPEFGQYPPYAKYYEDENYKNLKIHASNLDDKVAAMYDYGDALPYLAGVDPKTNLLLFFIASVIGFGGLITLTSIGLLISAYMQADEIDKKKIFEEYKKALLEEGFTEEEIKESFDKGIDQLKKYT